MPAFAELDDAGIDDTRFYIRSRAAELRDGRPRLRAHARPLDLR